MNMMKASSLLAPITRRLEGKVAVITGGARGIGETTARHFLRHGAKVVIADIQDDLAHSLRKHIDIVDQNSISFIHCDVSNDSHVTSLINTTLSKHGKLDIMFANAGINIPGTDETRLLTAGTQNFEKVMDVNVYGSFLTAKHAARVMIPARKGSIIFTASVQSVTAGDVSHAYAASKHAIVGLSKNLGVELGQYGIRVNCISPFGVDTPMLREGFGYDHDEEIHKKFISQVGNLKGAAADTEDVAAAAVYLGSDEARYVSGLNLVIDGGYSTTNVALRENLTRNMST